MKKNGEWKGTIVLGVIVGVALGYLLAQRGAFSKKRADSGLSPALVAKRETIYKKNCISCHGERGIGENPADIYAIDEKGNYIAPPLNESAHAWHHTDEQLMEMILEGSLRNPRMIAWKKEGLSIDDARALVEYIKSLWSERIRKYCQGPKHMECM